MPESRMPQSWAWAAGQQVAGDVDKGLAGDVNRQRQQRASGSSKPPAANWNVTTTPAAAPHADTTSPAAGPHIDTTTPATQAAPHLGQQVQEGGQRAEAAAGEPPQQVGQVLPLKLAQQRGPLHAQQYNPAGGEGRQHGLAMGGVRMDDTPRVLVRSTAGEQPNT